ncbi:hypothetical protein ACFVJO_29930, partial [Escherichia coli]
SIHILRGVRQQQDEPGRFSICSRQAAVVLMYLLCVFLVYRRWIAPLPVVGQLRNVGVPWLVGAMAVVYVGVFLLGKALALPAE